MALGTIHLIFSVRRGSTGLAGTDVRSEVLADTAPPVGNFPGGQASDLFSWDGTAGVNHLADPSIGWASGFGGDEAAANLRLPNPNQNHRGDNVDGYDRSTMRIFNPADMNGGWHDGPGPWGNDNDWNQVWPNDGPVNPDNPENPNDPNNPWGGGGAGVFPPYPIFFSLRTGSPSLAALGYSSADILAVGGGFGPVPVVFVSHAALGLQPTADLDALNMEVRRDTLGNLYANQVRFSVRSGTTAISGADILYWDGTSSSILHTAADLGLNASDDVDALESVVVESEVGIGAFEPVSPSSR